MRGHADRVMKSKVDLSQLLVTVAALVGQLTAGVSFLKWLTWGESVGFDTVNLNLIIVQISFAFKMQVNVLQVILVSAALLLYKKVR